MKAKLPQGLQDYIGAECYNKVQIEEKISKICASFGYERVQTAAMESMSNFCGQHGSIRATRMFKMTDLDGDLIVARPDATLQIMRIAANKFPNDLQKRFYYITDTFVLDSQDYNRELSQVGMELLGSDDAASDVEIIELAVKACEAVGLQDFQIEIGNINFFYGILEGLNLSKEDEETLRGYVNKKDMIACNVFLRDRNVSEKKIATLNSLPTLFGGEEIFDRADKIADTPTSRAAVGRLREIMAKLKDFGIDRNISVDLGMVKTNNYYSGLVLRGISRSLGHAFIDGGRYDRLSNNYNIEKPAVGLSIWMKRLLMALDRQGGLPESPSADICVVSDEQSASAAHDYLSAQRANGRIAVQFFGCAKAAKEYCLKNGVRVLVAFAKGVAQESELWQR